MYTGIDGSSKYTSYAFENNQPVFTVEQGTLFYLKLKLSANPRPSSANLSKNGTVLQSSPWGNITLDVDSVTIPSVQSTDAGNYTISCSNSMGEGRFSFRLKVVGKTTFILSSMVALVIYHCSWLTMNSKKSIIY